MSTLFCDSQSVIFLSKDQMFHDRMKHIDVHEIIAYGDIVASKIGIQDNTADMMTKSLPIAKFVHCSSETWLMSFALWDFVVEEDMVLILF